MDLGTLAGVREPREGRVEGGGRLGGGREAGGTHTGSGQGTTWSSRQSGGRLPLSSSLLSQLLDLLDLSSSLLLLLMNLPLP